MEKKLIITTFSILILIMINSCCTQEKENMKYDSCLTQTKFNKVFKRVMMNPSITNLMVDDSKWEIQFYIDNDIKRLVFILDGQTSGFITSDLEVFSTIKTQIGNEKMKKDMEKVFCILVESYEKKI